MKKTSVKDTARFGFTISYFTPDGNAHSFGAFPVRGVKGGLVTTINNCVANIERMKTSVKDGSVWAIRVFRYTSSGMANFYHVSYETAKADPEALAANIVNYWESIKDALIKSDASLVQFVESRDLWYQHFFCYTYPVVFGDGTKHEPLTHGEHQYIVRRSGERGFVKMADMLDKCRPVLDSLRMRNRA